MKIVIADTEVDAAEAWSVLATVKNNAHSDWLKSVRRTNPTPQHSLRPGMIKVCGPLPFCRIVLQLWGSVCWDLRIRALALNACWPRDFPFLVPREQWPGLSEVNYGYRTATKFDIKDIFLLEITHLRKFVHYSKRRWSSASLVILLTWTGSTSAKKSCTRSEIIISTLWKRGPLLYISPPNQLKLSLTSPTNRDSEGSPKGLDVLDLYATWPHGIAAPL